MKQICLGVISLFGFLAVLAQDKPVLSIPRLLQLARESKKDTARLDWQLQAAYAYVLKPGEDTVDLDSAILLVDQVSIANTRIKDPRVRAICYLVYSNAWRERKKKDIGKKNALLAVDAFGKLSDSAGLAYAYVEAANYYDYRNPEEASQKIQYYQLAAPLFARTGRVEMQASTLEILADCIGNARPNGTDAIPLLLESLKLYTSIGHKDLRSLYNLLGNAYYHIGDHENALSYALLAVKQEEAQPGQSLSLCTSYNRLGMVYYGMNDFKNAGLYFNKATDIAIRFKDTVSIKQTEMNYVNSLVQQKEFPEALAKLEEITAKYPFTFEDDRIMVGQAYIAIYLQEKKLDAVRPYIEEFIRIDSKLDSADFMQVIVKPIIIRYALTSRQYDMARKYAIRLGDFCKKYGYWTYLYSNYYMLFKADSAQRNYKSAIVEYEQFVSLRDSLVGAANGKQIAALKLGYETEKKDKDIQLLTRQQELSMADLRQANLSRNAVLGGSLMLLILLAVSYNQYRVKRRSNQLLQKSNLSQRKLLGEKEWLLKEIHHRVKNNLQIAMSLLNTQSFYLENDKALAAIHQSRNRMYAMSLIHQRLYQSDNLELIDMSQYIPELTNYIRDGYSGNSCIAFETHVDPIRLDVSQAVPIGLIINEAVTNSIKYAFPDGKAGTIRIQLQNLFEDRMLLEIADDGVGLGEGFDISRNKTMGMQLIDSLNQQLEGKLVIENKVGLVISIVFVRVSEQHAPLAMQLLEKFS